MFPQHTSSLHPHATNLVGRVQAKTIRTLLIIIPAEFGLDNFGFGTTFWIGFLFVIFGGVFVLHPPTNPGGELCRDLRSSITSRHYIILSTDILTNIPANGN